jgi:hypothetical protein
VASHERGGHRELGQTRIKQYEAWLAREQAESGGT